MYKLVRNRHLGFWASCVLFVFVFLFFYDSTNDDHFVSRVHNCQQMEKIYKNKKVNRTQRRYAPDQNRFRVILVWK